MSLAENQEGGYEENTTGQVDNSEQEQEFSPEEINKIGEEIKRLALATGTQITREEVEVMINGPRREFEEITSEKDDGEKFYSPEGVKIYKKEGIERYKKGLAVPFMIGDRIAHLVVREREISDGKEARDISRKIRVLRALEIIKTYPLEAMHHLEEVEKSLERENNGQGLGDDLVAKSSNMESAVGLSEQTVDSGEQKKNEAA